MKQKQASLRHSFIASPKRVGDPVLRAALESPFGDTPIWVLTVSQKTLERVTKPGQPKSLGFAVCRRSSGRDYALLVLQVANMQLRCVVGLNNPFFSDILIDAHSTGVIEIVFGTDGGGGGEHLRFEVDRSEVQALLAESRGQDGVPLERRVVEMTLIAANCRDVDELPSLIAGFKVKAVEASLITLGEAMVGDAASEHVDEGGSAGTVGSARDGTALH